mgnify:CR=1 FL=1
MQYFSINEIKEWDRFYRANFINSLQGFKPACLLGTVNERGQPNLAIFSNIVHIGADPALMEAIVVASGGVKDENILKKSWRSRPAPRR